MERRPSSPAELAELRRLAQREISDAGVAGLSLEGKFEHAYAAARALALMVVRTEGYRPTATGGSHYNTFLALEAADPGTFARYSAYLDTCRAKRNDLSYDLARATSETEVRELLKVIPGLAGVVDSWVARRPA